MKWYTIERWLPTENLKLQSNLRLTTKADWHTTARPVQKIDWMTEILDEIRAQYKKALQIASYRKTSTTDVTLPDSVTDAALLDPVFFKPPLHSKCAVLIDTICASTLARNLSTCHSQPRNHIGLIRCLISGQYSWILFNMFPSNFVFVLCYVILLRFEYA